MTLLLCLISHAVYAKSKPVAEMKSAPGAEIRKPTLKCSKHEKRYSQE